MNTLFNKKIFFSFIIGIVSFPVFTLASTIYMDTKDGDFFVGDNIIINVRVNTDNKEINVVDGKITFDYDSKLFSVGELSTAGSAFSLWPRKPSLSINEKEIYFVGGIPEGLKSKNALLFRIIINLEKTGKILINTSDVSVYLNDGKGTKDIVNTEVFSLNILPKPENFISRQEWVSVVKNDRTPPEPFDIYLGQEGSVFDGQKFISFNTVDYDSGIAHYEVIEGDSAPVRSSDTYVLQEQNKPVKVVVIAYDSAGNARKSVYSPTPYNMYNPIVILVIIILVAVFIKMRKNKNEELIKE